MKRRDVLLTILGFLVFIGIYFVLLKPADDSEDIVRSLDTSVEKFDRTYIEQRSTQSTIISDTTTVFRPATVRKFRDRIYVSDFSDFTIYEYDIEGNVTDSLMTGRGEGPGEFINLTDFDVIDNNLWAVDSQSLRITSFSLESGEVIKSISVDRRPYRITCLQDGFIVNWFGTELLFSKFDYNGNELFKFGEVIEDQLRHVMSLSGTIRSNREDSFVYIPSYASLIYVYNNKGELVNIIQSPDGLEFPITRREGAVSRAPEFTYYRDGYIDNNELYVYTNLPGSRQMDGEWVGDSLSVVDKYNLFNGTYQASVQLPFMHSSGMYVPERNYLFTSNWEEAFRHSINGNPDF